MRSYRYIPYASYIADASRRSLSPKIKENISNANSFILMHNFVAETYQTGVLISIAENKKKYKFVSNIISNILGIQKAYELILKANTIEISNDALEQLDDMSDNLQYGLSDEISKYQIAVDARFAEMGCNDKLMSMLYVSRKLVEICVNTFDFQVRYLNNFDGRISGIIGWMSFSKMLPLYDKLQSTLRMQQYFDGADRDLTVLLRYRKVRNTINDAEFIATHMGIDTSDKEEREYVEKLSKHINK